MKKVIAPYHYTFKDIECYELKSECTFDDAFRMHHEKDQLRKNLFLIKEHRYQNFKVEQNQVMEVKNQRNKHTEYDYFFFENGVKKYLLIVYSWGRDFISHFLNLEKKETIKNAYDIKSLGIPVVNGVEVFGIASGSTIIKDFKTVNFTIRVTKCGKEEYLENYYKYFIEKRFSGVKVKNITISYQKDNSGFHSYAGYIYQGNDLYQMNVKAELDIESLQVPPITSNQAIEKIKELNGTKNNNYRFVGSTKDKKNILLTFKRYEDEYNIFHITLDSKNIIKKVKVLTGPNLDYEIHEMLVGMKWTREVKNKVS